jgi:sortase A
MTLAVIGVLFTMEGSRIYLKAILAQYLLQSAWSDTQRGALRAKAWPWAGTWPVAQLTSVEHDQEMIVLAGATGRTLAFGPAHLLSSARPGEVGNTVLVGHRDTHFAFLKHLEPGNVVQLESADGVVHAYHVSNTMVVHENTTEVMAPDNRKMLTLITCYPFDAVVPGGPMRYVVQALGKATS